MKTATIPARRVSLRRRAGSDKLQEVVLVAPFLILFFLFTILPLLLALIFGFTNFNMLETPRFTGISNYVRMFVDDPVFLTAFKNTLTLAIITGPIAYFLSLFVAWLINELRPPLRSIMTLVFYAPSIAGNIYFIWTFIFNGDSYGMLNGFLLNLGFIKEPILWLSDTRYMMGVVIVVQLWLSLGVGFLSFIAGLQNVDRQIYESGAIDGIRNRFQELVYLTLPSMGPMLLFGAVMQISASFSIGAVPAALTGMPSTDYATHTLVLHMQDVGIMRFDMGYACAIATFLFIFMILLNQLIKKILAKYQ